MKVLEIPLPMLGTIDPFQAVIVHYMLEEIAPNISGEFVANAPMTLIVEQTAWQNWLDKIDLLLVPPTLGQYYQHFFNALELVFVCCASPVVEELCELVIDERVLQKPLASRHVASTTLEVFEVAPLPIDSYFGKHSCCVFGSNKSSKKADPVAWASEIAIKCLKVSCRGGRGLR